MNKETLIKKLKNKYPKIVIMEDGNGWVDESDNAFCISAEHGNLMSSNGYDLLNYWTENYEHYDMGVHMELYNLLEKNGWYGEWINPGVLAIVKNI